MRLRVSPLTDDDIPGWQSVVRRLPAVASVDVGGFDGLSAIFVIGTPSVARLLQQLGHLATKVEASLNPTITGEIGLPLRSTQRTRRAAG